VGRLRRRGATRRAIFAQMDSDGNGEVDQPEFKDFLLREGVLKLQGPPASGISSVFASIFN
jgi:hypothetical protein